MTYPTKAYSKINNNKTDKYEQCYKSYKAYHVHNNHLLSKYSFNFGYDATQISIMHSGLTDYKWLNTVFEITIFSFLFPYEYHNALK